MSFYIRSQALIVNCAGTVCRSTNRISIFLASCLSGYICTYFKHK